MVVWREMKDKYPEYSDVIDAGLDKLEDYWNRVEDVPAYTLAMLVNPSVKLNWFRKCKPHRLQWAKDTFVLALSNYRPANTINTPAPNRRRQGGAGGQDWAYDILGSASFEAEGPRAYQSLQEEVDLYLADRRHATKTTLGYWEEHQDEYPTIYALALDILPIQGSAVPCERVFSSAKETMTPRRNRIRPKLMEALQMLKYSHRHGVELDFTKGTSETDEIELLERNRGDTAEVSSDYATYVSTLGEDDGLDSDSEEDEEEDGDVDDDYDLYT